MGNYKRVAFLAYIFLLFTISSYAQSDTTKVKKKEKLPFTLKPQGVRVGTDIYPLIFSAFESQFTGYELNADVSFDNRLYTTLDIGFQDANRVNEEAGYRYTNTGSFFRFGVEYNFMHRRFAKNAIFVGLKYAIASFEHQADYSTRFNYWNTDNQTIEVKGLQAQWAELNTGLKVEAVKNLYLGIVLRVKFKTNTSESDRLTIAEIPGFGINKNTVRGGISYQLLYRIPFSANKKPKTP